MKKALIFASALAILAGFTSCNKDKNDDINLDDIVLDGFYVYGDATGSAKVDSKNAMSAGINEVEKAVRQGMYEKYVYLEANKDFALIENSAGNKKFYGANLQEVNYGYDENDPDCKNYADNPNMPILQGKLIIGEDAPKMQVKETGLYHIVLDNNSLSDLADGAQIIVHKADFGVRGGMNGWGFTAGTATLGENGAITWVWEDQKLAKNGEFKFASCHGWKINLDADGIVKAEVSLGADASGKLGVGSEFGNIKVTDGGLYKIVLNYSPKAGAIGDPFTFTAECTQKSTTPETMYIIGNEFGNWDWSAASVVSMVPVHSHEGMFWAVRYMTTNTEFKFCAIKEWNGDFCTLGTNEGFVTPGNNKVEADGLYTIIVDLLGNKVTVMPAEIYGMGPCFGDDKDWYVGKHPFTNGTTATATLVADGDLRMYAKIPGNEDNWWQSEFNIYDGKIVYRATGGDQAAVTAGAGQTVELDFNAGTGSIK